MSIRQEQHTIESMIRLYCRKKEKNPELCADCQELLQYARQRLSRCTFGNDKPSCRRCVIHCYKPEMKIRIQKVMRYAGPRMLFYHPLSAINHLITEWRKKPGFL